jgi:hypothetical protein
MSWAFRCDPGGGRARRVRRLELPSRALDDRPKDNLIPMRLEQVPQHPLERGLVGREREDLDDVPVFVGQALGHDRRIRPACGSLRRHLRHTICAHDSMPSSRMLVALVQSVLDPAQPCDALRQVL